MPSNATFFPSFIFVVVVCRINKCTYIRCAVTVYTTETVWPNQCFIQAQIFVFIFLACFCCRLKQESRIKRHSHELLMAYCIFAWNEFLRQHGKYIIHKSIVHRPFLVAQSTQLEREKRNHLAFCLVWNFKSTKQILFR